MSETGDSELDALLKQLARSAAQAEGDPWSALRLAPGDMLADRYRIARLLGRGGMGAVFEAKDERLRRPVAIKIMRPELAADAELADRFRREALAASRVEHPHIVRILDYDVHDGRAYLAMELLRGESLKDRMARAQRLALEDALTLLGPVMEALSHAHSLGVVHRDVKPENVLLADEHGKLVPKLLDFGIAKLPLPDLLRLTASGGSGALGTPAYMAPEQFKRAHTVGPPADQYALGTILYQAITGRLPYSARSAESLVVIKATTKAEPPRELEPQIGAAIVRAIDPDPALRHPSVSALAAALRGEQRPWWQRAWPWGR